MEEKQFNKIKRLQRDARLRHMRQEHRKSTELAAPPKSYYTYEKFFTEDKPKIKIIRPAAVYSQSSSPFGIADELHEKNLRR